MSTRKRLIFVASRVPYPPLGGDKLKNYHLLAELAREFDLTLVVMGRGELDPEARRWLESLGELHYVAAPGLGLAANIARSPFAIPTPLQVTLYRNKSVRRLVRRLAPKHDAVFCSLVRTAQFAEDLDIARFCDYSDSIGLHYRHSLSHIGNPARRGVYALESRLMLAYEARVLDRFDAGFFLNRSEMEHFARPDKSVWAPLGCNEELLRYEQADASMARSLVFFGKMDYAPNKLAAEWFVHNVMPLLPESVDFHIIGAYPPSSVLALAGPRVKVRGFVEDPYALMRGALAVAAPMQTGGGVQNKLLEAMALGCVTLNSPRAIAPLRDVEVGRHLLMADSPQQYAEIVAQLLAGSLPVRRIGEQARSYIRERHLWSIAGEVYRSTMLERIARRQRAPL